MTDTNEKAEELAHRVRRLFETIEEKSKSFTNERKYTPTVTDLHGALGALRSALLAYEGTPREPLRFGYTRTADATTRKGEYEERHESFGMVRITRLSGGGRRLFGSHLEHHFSTIELTILRGVRLSGSGKDWYMGTQRGRPIAVVRMSPAQWAELVATQNVGDGVPCTIDVVDGIQMDQVPEELRTEQISVVEGFEASMAEMAKELTPIYAKIKELLEKPNLKVADRKEILGHVEGLHRTVRSNIPYWLRQYQEAAEKVVVAAKAEIDAFTTHEIVRVGIETLKERLANSRALEAGAETKKLGDGE